MNNKREAAKLRRTYSAAAKIRTLWVLIGFVVLSGCSNPTSSDDTDEPPPTLRADEPGLKATGCGMGRSAVRVNLGDLAGIGGMKLAVELARQRLANEVKCNATGVTFLVKYSEGVFGHFTQYEYRYDRKRQVLIFLRTFDGDSAGSGSRPEPPIKQVYQHINDAFVVEQKY